jgi:TolB-like protein
MSADKEQEYFSDGLTEEILNALARINELQVAARTSSFSFQGEHPDIATVARKLNVGAVLEGSVRRSSHTVRITAQLINAVTGFHLWSETYDRDLSDVLKLQTEIATAVATALKITLLSDVAARIEVGGTRNPNALDAYLRGARLFRPGTRRKGFGPRSQHIPTRSDSIPLTPPRSPIEPRLSSSLLRGGRPIQVCIRRPLTTHKLTRAKRSHWRLISATVI